MDTRTPRTPTGGRSSGASGTSGFDDAAALTMVKVPCDPAQIPGSHAVFRVRFPAARQTRAPRFVPYSPAPRARVGVPPAMAAGVPASPAGELRGIEAGVAGPAAAPVAGTARPAALVPGAAAGRRRTPVVWTGRSAPGDPGASGLLQAVPSAVPRPAGRPADGPVPALDDEDATQVIPRIDDDPDATATLPVVVAPRGPVDSPEARGHPRPAPYAPGPGDDRPQEPYEYYEYYAYQEDQEDQEGDRDRRTGGQNRGRPAHREHPEPGYGERRGGDRTARRGERGQYGEHGRSAEHPEPGGGDGWEHGTYAPDGSYRPYGQSPQQDETHEGAPHGAELREPGDRPHGSRSGRRGGPYGGRVDGERYEYVGGRSADADGEAYDGDLDPDGEETEQAVPGGTSAARRRTRESVRHAYYPGRRMNLGVVLLPLRILLGLLSGYAGMSRLCDPAFFDDGGVGSLVGSLRALHPWALAEPVRDAALQHPVGTGLAFAFLQVIVGVLTILGLWQRLAAGCGALLAALLVLAVSWRNGSGYDAPDIIYLAAWSPLIIAGAPVFSVDGQLSSKAWRTLGPRAELRELRLRVLRRGALVAGLAVGLTFLIGAMLGGAVRDAQRTGGGHGRLPHNELPGSPLPKGPGTRHSGSPSASRSPADGASAEPSRSATAGTEGAATAGVQTPGQPQGLGSGRGAPQPQAPASSAGPSSSGGSGRSSGSGGTGRGGGESGDLVGGLLG